MLPSAQGLDVPTLNDHMPYLLEELADTLESQPEESVDETLLNGSPPAHGRQRLNDGFNAEEVVAEYNLLRACIHDLAEEHGIILHGHDLRVVNRIIDEAIGLAVQTYATQLTLEIKRHRDQHLAFVAHDLRTPLQAIALTARVIEEMLADTKVNPQADRLLKVLRRNIQNLEKAVIDVIKSNGDSPADAKEKLERREVDLWPLVESAIHGFAPVAAASGVELINEVPDELVVYADAALLTRVFEGLISYAMNNAPRGKVVVAAQELSERGTECSVRHNGPALDREQLAHIFENGKSAESTSGIGIDLSFVRTAIEAHGGKVSAESSESGVTIRFCLPRRAE
jgi:signal transduction histidine kinase